MHDDENYIDLQKLNELRKQEEMKRQEELQRQAILKLILTTEARERLNNLKLVKPQLATAVEIQLIQLFQAGKITRKIDDDTLKALLKNLVSREKRDPKIRFLRK